MYLEIEFKNKTKWKHFQWLTVGFNNLLISSLANFNLAVARFSQSSH